MVHIWDLWVSHSSDDVQIHMSTRMASQLGEEIEKAMATSSNTASIHVYMCDHI
jgi:hypothetical protein